MKLVCEAYLYAALRVQALRQVVRPTAPSSLPTALFLRATLIRAEAAD